VIAIKVRLGAGVGEPDAIEGESPAHQACELGLARVNAPDAGELAQRPVDRVEDAALAVPQ
jgi:hypothetical protein